MCFALGILGAVPVNSSGNVLSLGESARCQTESHFVSGNASAMAVAADWEGLWAKGLKPGERFDICGAHPVLQHLLAAGKVPNGTAFVPGCGRGYDLEVMATPERVVMGLEYSSTAATAAREYLLSRGVGEQAQVLEGDFFEFSRAPVDAVYDYTFFCAIPPARRAGGLGTLSSFQVLLISKCLDCFRLPSTTRSQLFVGCRMGSQDGGAR